MVAYGGEEKIPQNVFKSRAERKVYMQKRIISLALCAALAGAVLSGCGTKQTSGGAEEINVLSAWQGDSVRKPDDAENNIVMKKIYEATGVKINLQYNNVTEIERLNTMFASGDMPDLVSAPMWGMDDAATGILKKAAKEDMIVPLDELLQSGGENIIPSLSDGLAKDFVMYDLEDEEFGGKHYFIPSCVTPVEERVENALSGLYIREDIMKALGIDEHTVKNSDELYELMKKIAAGGFKDANGQDIIPGGLLHSGGGMGEYIKSFTDAEGGYTGLYIDENGKVGDDFFSPLLDKQILYMRKLFSENLMDIEGLSQTSARAQEKISTGKYALVPGKYLDIYGYCKDTLYKTNPEMKYVALAPLTNANGNTATYKLGGTGGCAVLFIPSGSKKAESVIKVLNYLFTKDGYLLANFGVEGESYNINAAGQAEFIGEYADMDNSERFKKGIGSYARLTGLQYGKTYVKQEDFTEDRKAAQKTLQTEYIYKDGIRISYLELLNPKTPTIRSIKSNSRINEIKQKAYCAGSDDEALGYVNELREQIRAAGVEEVWQSVEQYMKDHPEEVYLY